MRAVSDLPLVTVVTPSYNQASFLEQTILSVLSQDYTRIEYMIIDGGSTDGSVEIIEKYAAQLAFWVSESDGGQSEAINKGWQRAQGEIVAYLNSDDTYTPGAIREAVAAFQRHPDAGLAHGSCAWVDAGGREIGLIHAHPFTLDELILQNQIAQPAAFVRRAALEQVGLLDTSLHYIMDYDLWLAIALCYPVVPIRRTLARFRLHDESKTSSRSRHFLADNLKILDKVFSSPRLPAESQGLRPRAVNLAYYQWALQCYSSDQWEDGREIIEQLYSVVSEPLAYPRDVITLFANHMVTVLRIRRGSSRPIVAESEEWLARVLAHLPPQAAGLRDLRPQILSEANLAWGFDAHASGQSPAARRHMLRALRYSPAAAGNRGVWSVLVKNTLPRNSSLPTR